MNVLYIATRVVAYAIEAAAIAVIISGIINSYIITMFAGIILYMSVRALEEKQASNNVKEDLMNKLNLVKKENDDETLWLLFQMLLVVAMVLLAFI